MSDMLRAALQTAADFGDVIPLSADRKPLVAFDRATSDPDAIVALWTQWPDASLGLGAWSASLVSVDVDHVSKGHGDGFASLAKAESAIGVRLPATRTHRTKSGGRQLIYSIPRTTVLRSAQSVLRGLDALSVPGLDIVAGRAVLRWVVPGYTLEDPKRTDCEPLPEAWVEALTDPPPPPPRQAPVLTGDSKERRYALAALERESSELCDLSAGRNVALTKSAFRLGQLVPHLNESEIESFLLTACEANGALREHGQRACVGTIRRQVRAGQSSPRRLA